MIILVTSRRRENDIYARLCGVLLPHLPLELLQIVTKMYHIFIQRLSLEAHIVTKMHHIDITYIDISQKYHIQQAMPMIQWLKWRLQTIFELINTVENGNISAFHFQVCATDISLLTESLLHWKNFKCYKCTSVQVLKLSFFPQIIEKKLILPPLSNRFKRVFKYFSQNSIMIQSQFNEIELLMHCVFPNARKEKLNNDFYLKCISKQNKCWRVKNQVDSLLPPCPKAN